MNNIYDMEAKHVRMDQQKIYKQLLDDQVNVRFSPIPNAHMSPYQRQDPKLKPCKIYII